MDFSLLLKILLPLIGGAVLVGLIGKYTGTMDLFQGIWSVFVHVFEWIKTFFTTVVLAAPPAIKILIFLVLFWLFGGLISSYTIGLNKVCGTDDGAIYEASGFLEPFVYYLYPDKNTATLAPSNDPYTVIYTERSWLYWTAGPLSEDTNTNLVFTPPPKGTDPTSDYAGYGAIIEKGNVNGTYYLIPDDVSFDDLDDFLYGSIGSMGSHLYKDGLAEGAGGDIEYNICFEPKEGTVTSQAWTESFRTWWKSNLCWGGCDAADPPAFSACFATTLDCKDHLTREGDKTVTAKRIANIKYSLHNSEKNIRVSFSGDTLAWDFGGLEVNSYGDENARTAAEFDFNKENCQDVTNAQGGANSGGALAWGRYSDEGPTGPILVKMTMPGQEEKSGYVYDLAPRSIGGAQKGGKQLTKEESRSARQDYLHASGSGWTINKDSVGGRNTGGAKGIFGFQCYKSKSQDVNVFHPWDENEKFTVVGVALFDIQILGILIAIYALVSIAKFFK